MSVPTPPSLEELQRRKLVADVKAARYWWISPWGVIFSIAGVIVAVVALVTGGKNDRTETVAAPSLPSQATVPQTPASIPATPASASSPLPSNPPNTQTPVPAPAPAPAPGP